MKSIFKRAALSLVIALGSLVPSAVSAQYDDDYDQDRDVSYQDFYDELSPHGRWVDYPGQGYVWVPDAGEDFRPYSTNGHWVWSDNYEWVWVSDYDWGWAPFHYGRWDNDLYYGWYWVPGYEWSPAWVAWRDGGDYYGWAPIRPGINININFNIGGYAPPVDFWSFAPRRYITSPRIYDYYIDRRQNVTIINHTTIISNNFHYTNNYGFRSGPRRYDAERYCGTINPVRFRQSYTPGRTQFRNNEVSIYRPNVRRDNNRTFTPRSFERYDQNSNSDFGRTNSNANRNNNTIDGRTTRTTNRPGMERRNDDTRQQQRSADNNDRRFERNGNSNDFPNRNGDRRVITQSDRPDRTTSPGNPGNNRRFEGRDNSTNNNPPVRQPMERRQETRQPAERREENRQPMERRMESKQPAERRMETRQPGDWRTETRQPVERRQETRSMPQQPVERRQEIRQPMERRQETRQPVERRQEPSQQTQPRQFERRDADNRQPSTSGNGNNGGNNDNGRRRF